MLLCYVFTVWWLTYLAFGLEWPDSWNHSVQTKWGLTYSTKLILVLGTRYFIFNTLCSSKKKTLEKSICCIYFAIYFLCYKKHCLYMFSSGIQFYWWYWWYRSLRSQVCGKTWGKFLREKANASQSPPYTISGLTTTTDRKAASSILNANAVLVECHNTPT